MADDLDALVTAVAATGEDVIAVDLTTPDVAEIGLSVVRVVVPGFHPLQMGHGNRCLGGRRLANHPSSVGGATVRIAARQSLSSPVSVKPEPIPIDRTKDGENKCTRSINSC